MIREDVERDLTFAGFLVFHCPLKKDSKAAIAALKEAQHHVVMITGDNVLTAVHTAIDLDMVREKDKVVILTMEEGIFKGEFYGKEGILDLQKLDFKDNSVAVTGEAFEFLLEQQRQQSYDCLLTQILVKIIVFARASPSQKEAILTTYKSQGYTTLMCGDGTNDVGALKQAHVGIALLDGKPEDLSAILKQTRTVALRKRQIEIEKSRLAIEERFGSAARGNLEKAKQMQGKIEQLTMTLEQEEVPMVRLGDASVAAPFTSKISTIEAVCNLVRKRTLFFYKSSFRIDKARKMYLGNHNASQEFLLYHKILL